MERVESKRKGQMEVFGLALIVILLVIGMIFVVSFMLLRPSREIPAIFVSEQLTKNLVNEIPKVTTDCNKYNLGALLMDCATYGQPGTIACGGETYSCEKAHDVVEEIFKNTLEKEKVKYFFRAYVIMAGQDQGSIFDDIGQECLIDEDITTGQQPLPLDVNTLILELQVCHASNT
ncbi:hypothetical protein KY330_00740 [Candidatus Woesearchaeota archaeon]|nr:hypothetical protein [Candidatus Woesearchaeota archaeon]